MIKQMSKCLYILFYIMIGIFLSLIINYTVLDNIIENILVNTYYAYVLIILISTVYGILYINYMKKNKLHCIYHIINYIIY